MCVTRRRVSLESRYVLGAASGRTGVGNLYAYPIGAIPTEVIDNAAEDALSLEAHGYTSAYEEYSVGRWASAPLWSDPSGQATGEVHEHDEPAQPIPSVRTLTGINALISNYFDVPSLRCARLFRASHGAIVLPHRDYLEHNRGFTRIHVPLVTDAAQARNTEDNSCFHMRRGEVWYLDARRTHSGGVTGSARRVHLVLDFTHTTRPVETILPSVGSPPDPLVINRPALPENLVPSYIALAPYLNAASWREIFYILARVHLRYEAGAEDVYTWLERIAEQSGEDHDILVKDIERMKKYYISDGPTTTETFDQIWEDGAT